MPRTGAIALSCAVVMVVVVSIIGASPAMADGIEDPGVSDLNEVIDNIRTWVMGLLLALATLLLTIGGVRYLLASGDPGEVAKSKDTLKYAALGFAVAILAPVLVEILRGFVGAD